MVTAAAVLHGKRPRLLARHGSESPVALQLGGDDPTMLAEAAAIGVEHGFDEINLNVGCPSDRVQSGNFGACLMLQPERVAACVTAMRATVPSSVPVTVKHRIGVDEFDDYDHMRRFVDVVAEAGADRFSVHARKAWLSGLSPKQNRTIPPLRPEEIYRLKRERPDLPIEINGGIRDLETAKQHLEHVDAVMIGRAAWDTPYLFAAVDHECFGAPDQAPSRREVLERYLDYAVGALDVCGRPVPVLRPVLNLYAGEPGNRAFKRTMSELCQVLAKPNPPPVVASVLAAAAATEDIRARAYAAPPLPANQN
jgi:tRNA-dihydrouridine synthase A